MEKRDSLSIGDFATQLSGDVSKFKEWWEDADAQGRSIADTMSSADWFEQFLLFVQDGGVEVH